MTINWKENYQRYRNIFWKNYEYYKKREDLRSYIELVLSLLAIIIFSTFAIKPTAIAIISLNKEIRSKQETIQKMDAKISNLQKTQQLIQQEQDRIKLLDKAIPLKPEAESFIHELAGIATLNNVNIASINIENLTIIGQTQQKKNSSFKVPEGINMITFSSSFSGEFGNLNEFINKLENFIRPLTFEQLSITKSKEENELNLNITINVPYYQPINNTQSQKTIPNNKEEDFITK